MVDNPPDNERRCVLPDPDNYPPKLLYHCRACGCVYRRSRITRRWKLIQHGTRKLNQ